MTFEYVPTDGELPTPKTVFTESDISLAVPMIFEFISKIEPSATGTPIAAIQVKLNANVDEADQAIEFLQRYLTTDKVIYRVTNGSIYHIVTDRKTTPLDRIIYIVRVP